MYDFLFLGNIYLNNVLTGFAELIGNLITIPVIRYIGLRKTTLTLNLLAGAFMFLTLGLLRADSTRYSPSKLKIFIATHTKF